MPTTTSRLTRKFQATIPKPIRQALELRAGDAVAFDLEDGVIRLRKASPLDKEWTKAVEGTLTEWTSAADDEAYRDL